MDAPCSDFSFGDYVHLTYVALASIQISPDLKREGGWSGLWIELLFNQLVPKNPGANPTTVS
jgi:hypothetical protein